ncbi:MAG TPA: hypothetical protein VG225_05955 [Terracidiphilus sp.]|jgi:hypothetical protein|nr:hypothetical protein [Terracidiphilus sp.]
MEITLRSLWTLLHGMGFGMLYLLAFSGALVEIVRFTRPSAPESPVLPARGTRVYLLAMVALAWGSVLTGTYVIYPWYRAVPPPGTTDLREFSQRLLLSRPATAGWHTLGMEWKEHVAWLVPIAISMVAAVVIRYGSDLRRHRPLRTAVLCFAAASFLAAGIAGFFGAMLNKFAPVVGGNTIHLSGSRPQ